MRTCLSIGMLLSLSAVCAESTTSNQFTPPSANSDCSVCRAVTQGFADLHGEWSALQGIKHRTPVGAPAIITDGASHQRSKGEVPVTYEAAINRFCQHSFLSGAQQRLCYVIEPFTAEVAKWLNMGVPPDRVCRKLSARNPDAFCFGSTAPERPDIEALDWRNRPLSTPEGVECSIEHRNSPAPRWVLLN